jgi:histidinol-phosphate/aromatic aminotransferase/cobyric acid decarboxylase-like protein/choline kinase
MKAVILAAGYGRRMRPLTDDEHKSLLTVAGRTIMGRIIDGLVAAGVTDIVVATGYLADRVESYLARAYPQIGFTFVRNERFDKTNNIHSLALVFDEVAIEDDVILIESDLIYEPEVIERLISSPHENVALVDRYRPGMDGTVVTVSDQIVTSIIPPHLQGHDFDFSDKFKTLNVYKFSRAFCAGAFRNLLSYYTSVVDENAYYELLLGILIYVQKATIHAELIRDEVWAEIDDPNDLEEASFTFDPDARVEILGSAFGGYWHYDIMDFCFLRNMYFPTDAVLAELKGNFENLALNYGSNQRRLNQKLGYALQCDPERVTLLNGASQIYPILPELFAGRRALLPRPTFEEFRRSFEDADFYEDRVGIEPPAIEAGSEGCDVVVIVNPNNPTGSFIETGWILDFARRHPDKTVLVDESFIEFAPTGSVLTHLRETRAGNVVVVKSLSKSLGVPGLRLGCVFSQDESFNEAVRHRLPVWNSNSLAEGFLEVLLKHRPELEQSFADTIRDRTAFAAQLGELPCVETVFPSAGNFLLVRFVGGAADWQELPRRLAARSLHVKDVSGKFDDGRFYLRLAVRMPDENLELVRALRPWKKDPAPDRIDSEFDGNGARTTTPPHLRIGQ